LPAAARLALGSVIESLPTMRGTRLKGRIRLLKKMARSGSLPPRESFLRNCTYFDAEQQNQLFTDDVKHAFGRHDQYAKHLSYFDHVSEADFLNQMLYLDTKTFMPSLNLTYNDKMSMASSVEVRVPFLDRQLAEFVAQNVPPGLKLSGFFRPQTKYILRKAMAGMLTNEVLRQPKAGFGAPVDYWLMHDLRGMVDDLLSESQLKMRGIFKPDMVRKLIGEHRRGDQDWSMQIWQLLTLELWMQTFIDRAKGAESSAAANA
jgi:asparagine synthase (glutamine-hydrolysing)